MNTQNPSIEALALDGWDATVENPQLDPAIPPVTWVIASYTFFPFSPEPADKIMLLVFYSPKSLLDLYVFASFGSDSALADSPSKSI